MGRLTSVVKRGARWGLGVAAAILSLGAPAAAGDRPNVVFILGDDHGADAVGAYGGTLIPTPNIDRLARQGMRFDNAFVTSALCGPSRAVLITGRYGHANGFRQNARRPFDPAGQPILAELMQRAGYATALVGKWHLGGTPTGYDYWNILPGQGRYNDPAFIRNGQRHTARGYVTDLITDDAIAWLKSRPADKPFLLMVHHKAPHSPHLPAARHADLLADAALPEPSTLLDDYRGRAPGLIEDRLHDSRVAICGYPQYRPQVRALAGRREPATRQMYQTYFKGYLRLVAALDENVGRLLDHLDEAGLSDDTLVVYTSDHGFFLGQHGFFNKMWMYEPSVRVPLLVRWTGRVAPGSASDAIVLNLDTLPTLLDLAGAPVPDDVQGASMRPLLEGRTPTEWRQAFYYHYYAQYEVPEIIGLRTRTRKLIHYPDVEGRAFRELFDLEADPGEMRNLHDDPDRDAEVRTLAAQLVEAARRYGDAEAVAALGRAK